MLTFFILIPLIFATSASPIINGKSVGIDQGGIIQRNGEFPFIVFLEMFHIINNKKRVAFCGGVLVSQDAVLTAAHCLVKCKNNFDIRATVGVLDSDQEQGQKIHASGFKIHENFGGVDPNDPKLGHNDIALVWLRSKFELNENVKLATLPKLPMRMLNNIGTVIGWGVDQSQKRSKRLKRAELRVISMKKCEQDMYDETFNANSFCVKSDKGRIGTCRGDSGGPFLLNGVVRGILSLPGSEYIVDKNGKTKIICQPEVPQIFIEVSAYYNWVQVQLERRENNAENMPKNMQNVCLSSPMIYREVGNF